MCTSDLFMVESAGTQPANRLQMSPGKARVVVEHSTGLLQAATFVHFSFSFNFWSLDLLISHMILKGALCCAMKRNFK